MPKKLAVLLIPLVLLLVLVWRSVSPTQKRPEEANQRSAGQVEADHRGSDAATRTESESSVSATSLVSAIPIETRDDGYLGSDSCKECHAEHHQSWHTSYHRTMTQVINPQTAPAAIHDSTVEVAGKLYRFQRRGDDFLVEMDDPDSAGSRLERRLVMMTGSHHMHVFWHESGIEKTPALFPLIYLLDQHRWIPRQSAFLRSNELQVRPELGRWNSACCQCHSTHPRQRPVTGTDGWDTHIGQFGISCEACHGPGEGHVQFHQSQAAGDSQDTTQASASLVDSIVDPLKLPTESRSDICGQCHSTGVIDLEVIEKADFYAHGNPFRPGQVLDASHPYKIVRASPEHIQSKYFERWMQLPDVRVDGTFWPDGHIRVSGRDYNAMIESACFQRGELTCMSCHTMHQQDVTLQDAWKDDQLKPGMRGDDACLQCHQEYEELGAAHTHHPIDSAGSRCVNCHMPHTVYGILKSIRSHTISSPSVLSTIQTTRPNACSLCHLDHTLAETSEHLAQWYGQEKPELTEEETNTAASLLQLLKGDAAQRALQVAAYRVAACPRGIWDRLDASLPIGGNGR